ncbi:MAG: prolyl oligopeptidase family serine peptidase [Gemmatimonadota bacterium]
MRPSLGPVLLALPVLAACESGAYPAPPPSAARPVTDSYHGVEFVDDYRWLEDQAAPETRAWIEAQNAYAESVVGEGPLREAFRARLRELIDRADVGDTRKAGGFEYFTMRRPGEEMGSLYRRPAPSGDEAEPVEPVLDGTYEEVLDPTEFDATHRTPVEVIGYSEDGRLLAYAIRQGGADEIEVRFRDLETGMDLPDRLPNALYSGIAFDEDGTGLYYTHRSRTEGPRIRHHVLGSELSDDVELWGQGFGPTTYINMERVGDGAYRIFTAQHGWASNDLYLQRRGAGIEPVLVGSGAHLQVRYREGKLYVLTDWNAPHYRLMVVDPERPQPERWLELIPETEDVLESYAFIGDHIYATYLHEVENRIRTYDLQGQPVGEVEVPPMSTASVRAGDEGKALLTVSNHVQPAITYEIDLETGARSVKEPPEIQFDANGLTVDKVWFQSTEGARAPVYVIHREGIPLDGSHPAILNGYGGFNVAIKPGFSTTAATWVQAGGIYAIATLRGGSEFGEEWHQDGMLTHKQHVFDDFIAAAERLIELGYTSPDHLGISGGSNGGLLVASAMTQRPDLYRAVLCTYPDLDMVRFFEFSATNNIPALLEYGDARVLEQFEAMRQYSPYQAVRDGVDYPAVMLATGDLDTRAPPLQARKMTARLQAATASGRPVILWYDTRGGHAAGRGRPVTLQIEDTARELAFMGQQLGLRLPALVSR